MASLAVLIPQATAAVVTAYEADVSGAAFTGFTNTQVTDSDGLGSYFFGATMAYSGSGYAVFGLSAVASGNGVFVIGRNTASSNLQLLDYAGKGTGSSTGTIQLNTAQAYTLVGEVQFTSATTGSVRVWAATTGSMDFSTPVFDRPFTWDSSTPATNPLGAGATLYVRTQGANTPASAYTGVSVFWAETAADREQAFYSVVPEPSAAALGLGGLGIVLMRRRRK